MHVETPAALTAISPGTYDAKPPFFHAQAGNSLIAQRALLCTRCAPADIGCPSGGAVTKKLAVCGGQPLFAQPMYVTRPVTPPRDGFLRDIHTILDSAVFTNAGPFSLAFEQAVARTLDVDDCAVICNGTTALQIALVAADVHGEVITTPFTFPGTVHALTWIGLTPVFCDIEPDTLNLSPATVEGSISKRTGAIVPVHVFGTPCDIAGFSRLSAAVGVPLIYDAAHAFGVTIENRGIGRAGLATMFSFHATKLFSTFEGGAVTTADPELARRIRRMRNFGYEGELDIIGIGTNGKLTEIQSAFGLACLAQLDTEIGRRRIRRSLYLEALSDIEGIRVPRVPARTESNAQYMPILVDAERYGLTRDELRAVLLAENIVPRRYFYPLCSDLPAYRSLPSADPARLPVARRAAESVLCLPLYGEMPAEAPAQIGEIIRLAPTHAARVRSTAG